MARIKVLLNLIQHLHARVVRISLLLTATVRFNKELLLLCKISVMHPVLASAQCSMSGVTSTPFQSLYSRSKEPVSSNRVPQSTTSDDYNAINCMCFLWNVATSAWDFADSITQLSTAPPSCFLSTAADSRMACASDVSAVPAPAYNISPMSSLQSKQVGKTQVCTSTGSDSIRSQF